MDNILIVDRIEEGTAVCEVADGSYLHIPLAKLPRGVREGACLRPEGDGYVIDEEEVKRRKARNKSLFDQLKKL